MNFYSLKVKEVKKETEDTVSVSFDVTDDIKDNFKFIPGQYLTLKSDINGEDIRRSYSICTAPHENDLRVAIKQVTDGRFSTYANQNLKAGDILESMSPMGNFTPAINKDNAKNYVLFASGSGITPVLSIVKSILVEEPNSSVTLLYGNKGFSSIIFREELESLKNLYMDRFVLHHFLSRENQGVELFNGRIDTQKVKQLSESILDVNSISEVYICGPEQMIHDVSNTLKELGVSEEKINFELFTSPTKGADNKTTTTADETTIQEGVSKVSVIIDGDFLDFDLDYQGENILDAAVEKGADLPYSCKGGVCCTCRCKVTEGTAVMDVNYALDQSEVDEGYVLACQAHPRTSKVVFDFDER